MRRFSLYFCILSVVSIFQLSGSKSEAAELEETPFLKKIETLRDFNKISFEPGGFLQLGRSIKFLIDNRENRRNPDFYFLNAQYCPSAQPELKCHANPKNRPSMATSHHKFGHEHLRNKPPRLANDFYKVAYYNKTDRSRQFYAARMQTLKVTQPDGQKKLFFLVRFIERDQIQDQMIEKVMKVVKRHLRVPGAEVAFASNSEIQVVPGTTEQTDPQTGEVIRRTPDGHRIFRMKDLVGSLKYMGMQTGTTYGLLRKYPKDASLLEPMDIVLFDRLPVDLPVVLGTVTTVFQDVGSHINLKARERKTPNMVERRPEKIALFENLPEGAPIKLVVNKEDFLLETVSREEVERFYASKVRGEWKKTRTEEHRSAELFDEMCQDLDTSQCLDLSTKFGGKATGLGFLAHGEVAGEQSRLRRKLGYRLTPMGLGVPLTFYQEFVRSNGLDQSGSKLAHLISTEMGPLSERLNATDRKKLIAEIQQEFLSAKIPPQVYREIYSKVLALKSSVDGVYGVDLNKIKIRSSANVEDIENFNGAGLHDSLSARISLSSPEQVANENCRFIVEVEGVETKRKVQPKSLSCAIKGVYASLWNTRAVGERSFRRFDHGSATMGLAIQPSYKFRKKPSGTHPGGVKIAANSVLITRVLGTQTVYGYQISTQAKNGLVTNPGPGTRAELATMAFQSRPDLFERSLGRTLIFPAKPKAEEPELSGFVTSFERMKDQVVIAKAVEEAYCRARKDTYRPNGSCKTVSSSQRKPLALDMEFKIFSNQEVLIKQARPFYGK